MGGRGATEVSPLRKGGGGGDGKSFRHAEGVTENLEVLAIYILNGETQKVSTF